MKNTVIVALAALSLSATAFAAPYKSKQGYQVTPPPNFVKSPQNFMGTDAIFLLKRKGAGSPNLNVVVQPAPRGATLAQAKAQTSSIMARMLNGYHSLGQKSSRIGNSPSYTSSATFKMGTPPRQMRMQQSITLRNGKAFVFTFTSAASEWKSFDSAFQKSLASIKWTK